MTPEPITIHRTLTVNPLRLSEELTNAGIQVLGLRHTATEVEVDVFPENEIQATSLLESHNPQEMAETEIRVLQRDVLLRTVRQRIMYELNQPLADQDWEVVYSDIVSLTAEFPTIQRATEGGIFLLKAMLPGLINDDPTTFQGKVTRIFVTLLGMILWLEVLPPSSPPPDEF